MNVTSCQWILCLYGGVNVYGFVLEHGSLKLITPWCCDSVGCGGDRGGLDLLFLILKLILFFSYASSSSRIRGIRNDGISSFVISPSSTVTVSGRTVHTVSRGDRAQDSRDGQRIGDMGLIGLTSGVTAEDRGRGTVDSSLCVVGCGSGGNFTVISDSGELEPLCTVSSANGVTVSSAVAGGDLTLFFRKMRDSVKDIADSALLLHGDNNGADIIGPRIDPVV